HPSGRYATGGHTHGQTGGYPRPPQATGPYPAPGENPGPSGRHGTGGYAMPEDDPYGSGSGRHRSGTADRPDLPDSSGQFGSSDDDPDLPPGAGRYRR
ncbi:hypothetical protein AB0J52_28690, partial [Spirillospora sp. NPDC049652]